MRNQRGLWLVLGVGIGLAAVYLLPALALRGQVGAAQEGFYYYGRWFLLSGLRLWGDVTPKLTAMLLTVLGFVGCALVLLWRARAEGDARREALFWTAVAFNHGYRNGMDNVVQAREQAAQASSSTGYGASGGSFSGAGSSSRF